MQVVLVEEQLDGSGTPGIVAFLSTSITLTSLPLNKTAPVLDFI
jgi:hypothetical protein